jgi:chromosome segregation protein
VVENWEQAEAGMQLLRSDLEGRATFVVENGDARETVQTEIALSPLSEHLRFTNGLTGKSRTLIPRLANCYVAGNADQARSLAAENPQLFFLLNDGRCYHGQTLSGGRKKASGPLALKRELRQATTDLQDRERKFAAESSNLDAVQHRIAHLEAEMDRLRTLQQTREKDALALQHESRKLTEDSNRAASRISVARLEMERLQREKQRAAEQRDTNQAALAQKETERAQRESALETVRAEMETVEADAVRIREEHSTLRASLAGIEERSRSEHAALTRIEKMLSETTQRRDQLTSDTQRLGEHRSRLLAENIELDKRSTELGESILQLEDAVNRLAAEETQHRASLLAADEALRIGRARIEAAHERRNSIEIVLVRKQSEVQFLDETSRKELGISLEELVAQTADAIEITPEELAQAEHLYEEVKGKIENLGPINPQALEEHQEAQLRQDFLTAQRTDLIDSIRDTERAISEIENVSRARFLEAFEAINSNFKVSFTTLFGGGHGEMRLTDEANASESGIDIIASPPGKKLQNVLLLSGGEKSLAAMALLMAIFRYQPSPFCVLDEVDAPLDEANIGRLTRLLKEMASETQFIVITHSKKTMESAEAMYGVTMQEAGVSKLVSVRFQGPVAETAVA